jgi:hypothetical protein
VTGGIAGRGAGNHGADGHVAGDHGVASQRIADALRTAILDGS